MYADLHCHSHFSDGTEAPERLVALALEKQLSHLALTDHDCTHGVEQLWRHLTPNQAPVEPAISSIEPNADHAPLYLLAGVEISCDWNGLEIHVVGLLEDPAAAELQTLLSAQQRRRRERVAAIASKLDSAGIAGLSEALDTLPAAALTRSHIADFLVQRGACKSREKAFKHFLGRRGKAFVAAQWCDIPSGVAAIRAAGGIAVLAHPSRYPLTRSKLMRLLGDFRDAGGEAMEVSCGNLDPLAKKRLIDLAAMFELYYSCGSDFHTPQAQWTAIGKFPKLEPSAIKNAIWEHPKWHSIVSAGRRVDA